ncbi:hypothetical protein EVAR_17650_1 [Eumeta japonica]|uniref:Uncharacterized protein n=1 Tax=Eumeta variegata TaxID=151549 RepID=A0A4C1UTG5_EUMVA|nr:hypothetical protein EVAR_17650_1 [Eumeta japonica]
MDTKHSWLSDCGLLTAFSVIAQLEPFGLDLRRTRFPLCHVLVHEFMSIHYALAGWSGNRERKDERTKRKRGKEKVRSRSKIPISSKPAVRNFVPM